MNNYCKSIISTFLIINCFSFISLKAQRSDNFELQFSKKIQNVDPLLALPFHPIIKVLINNCIEQNKTQTEEIIATFQFYNSYIKNELKKQNIPMALQYLPMALSKMDIRYKDKWHRGGIWALPELIAIKYGLVVDNEIDERMDVYKSTQVACQYLHDLFFIYNDFWDVVIAYSEGAAGLNAAKIRLNSENTSPWELYEKGNLFYKEFIPNILSYAYLSVYYNDYHLQIKEYHIIQTKTVYLKSSVYLFDLCNIMNLSENDFFTFNPIIVRQRIIQPNTAINLPNQKAEYFIEIQDSIYQMFEKEQLRLDSLAKSKTTQAESEIKTITYVVKNGDCLGSIAKKYHISVSELKKWNHLKSDTINVGQRIIIYKD